MVCKLKLASKVVKNKIHWIKFNMVLKTQMSDWVLFVNQKMGFFFIDLVNFDKNQHTITCQSRFSQKKSLIRWKLLNFERYILGRFYFFQNWKISESWNFECLLIFPWNWYLAYTVAPFLKGLTLGYPKMSKMMFYE